MASPSTSPKRGAFGSRLGFILAASGSAIGLGNIWRFPYTAGENGGGAFVLVYLICVALIGVPVLLAELSMGQETRRNPVGAFKAIVPSSLWPMVGGLGVATGFGILAFYSVVAGWTLSYLGKAAMGDLSGGMSAEQSNEVFGSLVGSGAFASFLAAVFLLMTVLVVRGGVSGGIERASKILMPLFFLLLLVLALRSVTLPGGSAGLAFLTEVDFSKITGKVVMNALGQALFSLSLGMGAMITYGSYFPKGENMPLAGLSVAAFDTSIALLGGIIIFPALFSAGVDPAGGPKLVFVVLPTIFDKLPAGTLFAVAFYALLGIAALTSTISLLEVVVAYFVDERRWSREKAVWTIGGACALLAIPSAYSQGDSAFLSTFLGEGKDFLSVQSIIFGNYSLSIGALFICLFVGWRWGVDKAVASLETGGHHLPATPVFSILVRFVCPVAVFAVLVFILITGEYF
jgi:NSS family neurotransmitter:Na+ symporter